MATVVAPAITIEEPQDQLSGTPRAGFIDRWIYVFTAASMVVAVLTGFIPDSIQLLADARSGARPPLPPILHVHAALMGSFLLLMLAQTILVATGRVELHRKFGRIAFVLAPALVVAGVILAVTNYHQFWQFAQAAPPQTRDKLLNPFHWDDILIAQIRIGTLFAVLVTIGLLARRTNSGLHKRMMLLAPAMALPAAFARMSWLPVLPSHLAIDLYPALLLLPMIVWDLARNKRVHQAYVIWLAIYLPVTAAYHLLVGTPEWHSAARTMMGV
jgi:hypothetical protein